MVKADLPSHSRDSSPDKVSTGSGGSLGSLVSRTNSSASYSPDTSSSATISTTRESSPDYRSDQNLHNVPWIDLISSCSHRLEISIPESGPGCVSPSATPANVENQEKTPIPADSPLLAQVQVDTFVRSKIINLVCLFSSQVLTSR